MFWFWFLYWKKKKTKKQTKNRKKLAAGCSQLRWPEEFYCATSRQRLKAFTSAKSQQKLLISTQTTKRLIFLSSVSTWNNNNIAIVYPCMTSFRLMFYVWFDLIEVTNENPTISWLQGQLDWEYDDVFHFKCSMNGTRPASQLTWLINGQPVNMILLFKRNSLSFFLF